MRFRNIRLLIIFVLIAAGLSSVSPIAAQEQEKDGAWFKRSHKYRIIVNVASKPESRTAYIQFHSGGRCLNDGRDILITDDSGMDVDRRIVSVGPGDLFLVAFRMTEPSTYHVYIGSRALFAPPSTWYPRAGLLLRTYRRPEGSSQNADLFMQMVKKASILDGAGYRDTVFDGYNPFGPSDHFLSIYSGYIRIPNDGRYQFATNSDDSSILFVDDKPIAEFPGYHGATAVWGEKNGSIDLKAGIHKLDYFHVEYEQGQATVAGWKKPGDKYFSLIPVTAFVQIAPARIGRIETRKGRVPDFRSRFGHIYPVGENSGLIEIRFRQFSVSGKNIVRYKWDFGDGETSFEKSPGHIYAMPGMYNVSLSIQNAEGGVAQIVHRIHVFIIEGRLSNDLETTRDVFREKMADYSWSKTNMTGLKNLLEFYSVETSPEPARIIFFCRKILDLIPESRGDLRAFYALRIAKTMKDFPNLGDFQKRKQIYASIIAAGTSTDQEHIAKAAYELGDIELFYFKNYTAASNLYKRALGISADTTLRRLSMIRLADSDLYSGNLEEARKGYEKVPTIRDDEKAGDILRTAYGQIVESYMRKGRFEEALDSLNNWEWEYPEVKLDGYSFLLRIRINHSLNNLDEVSKYAHYILNVLVEDSYKAETYYILISLMLKANRKENALHQYEKMKSAFPKNFYTKRLRPAFETKQ